MTFGLTLADMLILDVLPVIGGGCQVVDPFIGTQWWGALWQAVIPVIHLIAVVLTSYDPPRAVLALTLMIGFALFAVGARCIHDQSRPLTVRYHETR